MPGPFRLSLLLLAFLLLAPPAGLAQPPPAAQPAPAPTTPEARPGLVAALDGILSTLRDDAERLSFVRQLEQLRTSLAGGVPPGAQTPATTEAAGSPSELPPEAGLLGAVAAGLTDVGESVRQQIDGGTLRDRFVAAGRQVGGRLAAAWDNGGMLRFLLWAGAGWGLAGVLLYGLSMLRWLRPRPETERFRPDSRAALWRTTGIEAARRLIPLVPAAVVIFAWPVILPRGWEDARLFLAVATPLLAGAFIWRLGHPLMFLLGPLRGWQIAHYARRRVLPWIVALAVLAVFSSTLRDQELRWIIGPDAALITAVAVDIVLGITTLVFGFRRRRAVQRLLIANRANSTQERSVVGRLAWHIAAYWNLIAAALVMGHLISRFFGIGEGSFFGRALLTFGATVLILAAAFALSGAIARLASVMQHSRGGMMRRLQWRYLDLARILLRFVVAVVIIVVCLRIWNFDLANWTSHGIGLAITEPLVSIGAALLVGWTIWVTVDTAVDYALEPKNDRRALDHSTRARTLLPMLRNFAMVVISALTVIAIMSNLGLNVAPLLAGAGVIGLAISFGSQQLVQDVITGLFMLVEDTIAIGDSIDTGDRAGTVESITIRTVRVRDGDGALHTIPFSQIKALKNRSRGFGVYTVKVVVGYDADLDRVMDIMNEVGENLRQDPQFRDNMITGLQIWGVDQFTPEGITIMGGLRTKALQQWGVGRAFNLRLKQRFDREGIPLTPPRPTVMLPSRNLWPEPETGMEAGSEVRQPG